MVDAFRTHIMHTKELGTCPIRQIGGCSFLYMRISNVYIVIVVSSNANAACAFKFIVEVCFYFYKSLILVFLEFNDTNIVSCLLMKYILLLNYERKH